MTCSPYTRQDRRAASPTASPKREVPVAIDDRSQQLITGQCHHRQAAHAPPVGVGDPLGPTVRLPRRGTPHDARTRRDVLRAVQSASSAIATRAESIG